MKYGANRKRWFAAAALLSVNQSHSQFRMKALFVFGFKFR